MMNLKNYEKEEMEDKGRQGKANNTSGDRTPIVGEGSFPQNIIPVKPPTGHDAEQNQASIQSAMSDNHLDSSKVASRPEPLPRGVRVKGVVRPGRHGIQQPPTHCSTRVGQAHLPAPRTLRFTLRRTTAELIMMMDSAKGVPPETMARSTSLGTRRKA